MTVVAITHHNGVRIAELGFALLAIGGALLALGAIGRRARGANLLSGLALAAGAVLVIVAAHWAHFG
jgi:hypothetical protein